MHCDNLCNYNVAVSVIWLVFQDSVSFFHVINSSKHVFISFD